MRKHCLEKHFRVTFPKNGQPTGHHAVLADSVSDEGPLLKPSDGTSFLVDYSLPENHVELPDEDVNELEKPCPRSLIVGTVMENDFAPMRGPLSPPVCGKRAQ